MTEQKATIKKIQDILEMNLKIPEYQRPYKWQIRHVQQLVNDLLGNFKEGKTYRIGTIVIHDNKGANDVVDGQQRLVSLSLLLTLLGHNNISLLNEKFNHTVSHFNISQNYEFLNNFIKDNLLSEDREKFLKYIFEKCEIVCVKLTDLDEAFQFFDSQNARGKPLEAYDLLKAYHLREMKDKPEQIVLNSVANWEKSALANEDDPNLNKVINQILFRLRRWQYGLDSEEFTNQELDTFKGVSEKFKYPYLHSMKAIQLLSQLAIHNPNLYNPELVNQGFQINQPLINGEWFFSYIENYRQLYDKLFNKQNGRLLQITKINHINLNANLIQFLDSYDGNSRTGDRYLRTLFENVLLAYYDKFGDVDFENFVNKAFLWVYRLRFHHSRIGFKTMENQAISANSLLNHIDKSYSPDIVLQFTRKPFDSNFNNVDKRMKEIFGVEAK